MIEIVNYLESTIAATRLILSCRYTYLFERYSQIVQLLLKNPCKKTSLKAISTFLHSSDLSLTLLPVAASSSLDSHVRIWDLDSGKMAKSIDAGPGRFLTIKHLVKLTNQVSLKFFPPSPLRCLSPEY